MWKRYSRAIYVALATSLVIILLSYLIDNKIELDWVSLQTVNSVAGTLSTILLFGVSWSLHHRFSASQQTLDKKAENVLELIELLQNVQFTISYNESKGYGYTIGTRPVSEIPTMSVNEHVFINKEGEAGNHYFDESVLDLYREISRLAENIFMPQNLSQLILNKLDMKGLFAFDNVDSKSIKYFDLVLSTANIPRSNFAHFEDVIDNRDNVASGKYVSSYNDNPVSIDEAISIIRAIHESALKWLETYSPFVTKDLNIEKSK